MDARDRFLTALGDAVSTAYYCEGHLYLSLEKINAIVEEQGVPDAEARATLDLLNEQGLLLREEGGWAYSDGVGLLLRHEQAHRRLFWERNKLRREILRLAAVAYDGGAADLAYYEDREQFVDAPWVEAYAASQVLAYLGLAEVRPSMGHNFRIHITPSGRELHRLTQELSQLLPLDAAEDESAGADVAPDALRDLILDVEQLLEQRRWTGAARELARGDEQGRAGHWTDAVREYYAALESGLKHRLNEAGANYAEGAALRDLAKLAASQNLVPTNYQALFGFADSIRSPRSHGAGARVEEVEVGRAEALLMANHVRSLLLYLGQRPD